MQNYKGTNIRYNKMDYYEANIFFLTILII